MIKKLLPYISKYKIYAILCPLAIIGEVLLEISIPILMSRIIDVGIANKDMAYILKTGGLMVLMALISLGFGAVAARLASVAGIGFGKEIRRALFYKIQDFSFSNIDRFSTASLVTRLTTDITNTQMAFMMIIRLLVRAPFMLVSATIMAFTINSRLVAIFLIAIPILAFVLALIIRLAFPRFQTMMRKYDRMNASIQENLVAIRVVKACVRSLHEKEKFRISADELMDAQRRAERVVIFNMPAMQFTMYGTMIAIIWFGGNMIIKGTMLTGELMSFISYVTQILMSLMMISMVFVGVVLSRASVSRIVEVLDEKIDITDAGIQGDAGIQEDVGIASDVAAAYDAGIPLDAGLQKEGCLQKDDCTTSAVRDGSISFENVCFSYNKNMNNLVLNNINFRIEPGEIVGIIGGTGSAKTSLVQLIPRLYDVTDGRVLVGGHDVRDYRIETLRNSVAMVLQKNVLFSGTIKENLRWGNPDASDDEIIDACKSAQAHDFIMAFPDGYETDLGQGGVNVSGGQKQRLCIARALLKKPKVVILDDSTSAVDTATDAKIRQAFREKLTGTTTIIIAQRITSVSDADKIIVLNEGKIDAIGTHEELLKSNLMYKEVYESQMKGADE